MDIALSIHRRLNKSRIEGGDMDKILRVYCLLPYWFGLLVEIFETSNKL